MGLDISHDAWHGAYGAFTRWRHQIAETAGYWVASVNYDDGSKMDCVMLDWGHLPPGHLMGEWPETPADPLVVLFTHQDCEGVIHPTQAGPLADRLEELLPLLPEGDGPGHVRNWRDTTQKFIDGCRAAVAAGEPLDFF